MVEFLILINKYIINQSTCAQFISSSLCIHLKIIHFQSGPGFSNYLPNKLTYIFIECRKLLDHNRIFF